MTYAVRPAELGAVTYPFTAENVSMEAAADLVPGLSWLRHPMPGPLKHVNVWILDGADGLAAVDGGPNRLAARELWQAVLAGRFGGRRLSTIVCTHHHSDHVALVGWLCESHAAPLQMTEGERKAADFYLTTTPDALRLQMRGLWRSAGWPEATTARAYAPGWFSYGVNVTPLPARTAWLREGDRLAMGNADWTIVIGSGHSPGHACLLDEKRGIFIAGDQVLPRISSNISLHVTELADDPLGHWLESIEKLGRLPAGLLVLPSHGEPFHGLHARLTQLRDGHLRRLERLRAHLATPRRCVDCFDVMFERQITDDVLALATGETLSHLRHLEVAWGVERDSVDGVWWYRSA